MRAYSLTFHRIGLNSRVEKVVLTGKEYFILSFPCNARLRTTKEWSRPCVYIWFREGRCLYIGCSKRGVRRLYDTRHRIHWNKVMPTDTFELQFGKAGELHQLERALITIHNPLLN